MTGSDATPETTSTGQVADAVKRNWVDRSAPAWTRPYLRLSRADRPIGTWLLLIPCFWGLGAASLMQGRFTAEHLWIAVGCSMGAWLMRGAGCTWNDITDRDFDAAVARTRSRPSRPGPPRTLSHGVRARGEPASSITGGRCWCCPAGGCESEYG